MDRSGGGGGLQNEIYYIPKLPKIQAQLSFWPISDLEIFFGSALGILQNIANIKGHQHDQVLKLCKLTISFHSHVNLLTIINPIFLSFYFLSVDDVWTKIC